MRENGITHQPGLAGEVLHDLAPLLAGEGIDLNETADVDMATLNAALARAVERSNMERFTPVGAQRAGALTVLRLTAEAIDEGSIGIASTVINGLQPEPDGDKPSIAHVIGVSLGALDTWHTDPDLQTVLRATRVPAWEKRGRAAATDILALARKGRAFDAIGSLHRRHNGLSILHGGILAVTGSLQAWAAAENRTVRELGQQALADS